MSLCSKQSTVRQWRGLDWDRGLKFWKNLVNFAYCYQDHIQKIWIIPLFSRLHSIKKHVRKDSVNVKISWRHPAHFLYSHPCLKSFQMRKISADICKNAVLPEKSKLLEKSAILKNSKTFFIELSCKQVFDSKSSHNNIFKSC